MRRIILCILGCILLLTWMGAAAEKCPHEHLRVMGILVQCKDYAAGHQTVETKTCICDDCGAKVIRSTGGEFTGHVFQMSESIHFAEDQMHLWVFICPDCWHVYLEEYPCAGGAECTLYSAQEGELPPIQYGQFISEIRELTAQDYVIRWLEQQKNK